MTRQLDVSPKPESPAPKPLVAVDRAIAELRRGAMVLVRSKEARLLMLAAEAVDEESLTRLAQDAGTLPVVVLTGRRAGVLGLADPQSGAARVGHQSHFDSKTIVCLADPCAETLDAADAALLTVTAAGPAETACIALAKQARLLPAVVVAPAASHAPFDVVQVEAADILAYATTAARSLIQVSAARVPLEGAENARIVAFRPSDGGIEHLAIIIGDPDPDRPVLARLHSECFTGDLLGSLRCDCGDQLRGAIAEIGRVGSGVLLYLAQEGRGIGLVNKLRAYRLQDQGFDTLDANLQLGFDDDERIYLPAAQMLRLLGIGRVRLMTNNPNKVEALARHGVEVAERVPHVFPSNDHNQGYLRTKATRSGHLF